MLAAAASSRQSKPNKAGFVPVLVRVRASRQQDARAASGKATAAVAKMSPAVGMGKQSAAAQAKNPEPAITGKRASEIGTYRVAEEIQITASLVKRCLGGDAVAWEEIVRSHNRRIYNICYRFTGSADDAEDLTQDVFIKIYRTLASYDLERGAFTTWITTVTRNLLVDHFRRSKQDRVTDSMDAAAFSGAAEGDSPSVGDQIKDEKPAPDARLATKETQKMVQQALQKLSPDLREAVILRDLQDMDYKEIAAALKLPEGTVKSRINRGRTELARLLSRTYKQAN